MNLKTNAGCILIELLLITILLSTTACDNKKVNYTEPDLSAIKTTLLTVAPYDTLNTHIAKEVFEAVEYIPLQTLKDSRFLGIDKLEIMDGLIYILDKSTNTIYIFRENGAYYTKISGSGTSYPFNKISDFSCDRTNKSIVIYDSERRETYFLDKSGKLLRSVKNTFEFYTFSIDKKTDSFFYYYRTYLPEKANPILENTLLTTTTGTGQVRGYLGYDAENISFKDVLHSKQSFYSSGNRLLFSFPFQYNVFELNRGGISGRYRLNVPPEYQMPQGFLYSNKYNNERISLMLHNSSYKNTIWNCTDVYMLENGIMTFRLQSYSKRFNTVFYNLNNDHYVRASNIYSDSLVARLPVIEDRFLFSDGIHLYTAISAKLMFQAKLMAGLETAAQLRKPMVTFFEKENNLSNPVIVKYKPQLF